MVLEHAVEHRHDKECVGLFCFIDAEPGTSWLNGTVSLDEKGSSADRSHPTESLLGTPWPAETSPLPTLRARSIGVGGVRLGSNKRVAAAVGEGSLRAVHKYLARPA